MMSRIFNGAAPPPEPSKKNILNTQPKKKKNFLFGNKKKRKPPPAAGGKKINKKMKNEIDAMIHQLTDKSNDELAPQIHILDDMKIVDFSSLTSPEHLIDALKNEINKTNTDQITIIIKI